MKFNAILLKNKFQLTYNAQKAFRNCNVLYVKNCDVEIITPKLFPQLKYVSIHPDTHVKTMLKLDMLVLKDRYEWINYKTIHNYIFIPCSQNVFKGILR